MTPLSPSSKTDHVHAREREVLLGALASQRQRILGALDGLDEAQLRTATLPSGWHPLGLVRHLTLSDERYWLCHVMGGQPLTWPDEPRGDWLVADDEPAADVIGEYRHAIAEADAVVAAHSLDDPPALPDPQWARWGRDYPDLRSIVMHLLLETANHAGQLDAARELIDGHQWVVLD